MEKLVRLMKDTGPARFLVPVGLVLIIFGCIMFGMKSDNFVEGVATITSVTEDFTGSEKEYDIGISYTVDGKQYNGVFDNLSGEFKTGSQISVWYDPEDPQRITNAKTPAFVPPVMIAAGVLAVIFGILQTVKAMKKSKELDKTTPGKGAPRVDFEGFKNASGVTEYYSRFDGNSLKPGYILEDADRNVLFEGTMTKNSLVGARTYEFNDHSTGSVTEHEVGHVMTQAYDSEVFSAKSWFKLDGENIWDLLHEKGLRISTDMMSKFPLLAYDVSRNGKALARIESCSMYVHEDEEAEHKLAIPTGRYYYRVWTDSTDFELIFLVIFAISETDQILAE